MAGPGGHPHPLIGSAVPARFGLLRALGAAIDYAVGEPLHFAMERKMLLGLKQRAEQARGQGALVSSLTSAMA